MDHPKKQCLTDHVDHGTSGDGGRAGLGQVVHLEYQPHAWSQADTLTTRQTQNLQMENIEILTEYHASKYQINTNLSQTYNMEFLYLFSC